MAMEAVQALVTRSQEVKHKLDKASSQLSRVEKAHKAFWKNMVGKCKHLYCKEDIKRFRKKFPPVSNAVSIKVHVNETRARRAQMTKDELAIADGYFCPFCLKWIKGVDRTRSPEENMRFWGTPDEEDEYNFNQLTSQDTSNWPEEKKTLLEEVKKEREEYLAKRARLEQTIEPLRAEYTILNGQLEELWDFLDKALGKDVERKKKIAALKEYYEQRIRDLTPSPRRPFNDPDAFFE